MTEVNRVQALEYENNLLRVQIGNLKECLHISHTEIHSKEYKVEQMEKRIVGVINSTNDRRNRNKVGAIKKINEVFSDYFC